jgi:hypothetical protein
VKPVTLWFYRQIAIGLMMLLAAPLGVAAQQAPAAQPAPNSVAGAAQPAAAADASKTQVADAAEPQPLPESPNPAPPQTTTAPQNSSSSQPATPQQQQPAPQQPLGTAVAPSEPASGIAASRPAGAAIAPARQKRTRSFMIKVGLLMGAAVAVGTVVALSSASPSRP